MISQLLGHFKVALAELPLGRPIKLRHLLAGDLLIEGLVLLELVLEALLIAYLGHIRVAVSVVAHGMALLYHPAHQLRLGLKVVAHQEKRGPYVVLFQRVQYYLRVAVLKARVEGDVQHLFVPGHTVYAVELREILAGGVGYGGLALLLEGEPPVGYLPGGLHGFMLPAGIERGQKEHGGDEYHGQGGPVGGFQFFHYNTSFLRLKICCQT